MKLKPLQENINGFEKTEPAAFVAEFKPNRPGHDIRFQVLKPVPPEISLLIGDVVDGLRSALEYAVTELTIAHSGRELDGTAFPVCTTRQAWEQPSSKSASGFAQYTGRHKTRGVSRKARTLIRFHQPFHRKRYWRRPLWVLDELWNINKHRSLHLTTTQLGTAAMTIYRMNDAIHIVRDWHAKRGVGVKHNTVFRRLTYTKGATEADMKVVSALTPQVVFEESTARQAGGHVLGTLSVLSQYVATVLSQLSTCDPRVIT